MFANCSPCGIATLDECYFEVLAIRLASEFQGFCRSFHDECIDFVASLSPQLTQLIRNSLSFKRRLDLQNANGETLREDFGRFSIELLALLTLDSPDASVWWAEIGKLNDAKNAGAHDSVSRRQSLNMPLTPQTCLRWRNDLNQLVVAMDRVICREFLMMFEAAPW